MLVDGLQPNEQRVPYPYPGLPGLLSRGLSRGERLFGPGPSEAQRKNVGRSAI
jgi:hypothetical protein